MVVHGGAYTAKTKKADCIIRRLHEEIVKHFPTPAARRQLASQGAEIQLSTPTELAALNARWTNVINALGVQPE